MTILVTGGAGFIGSHVVKELRSTPRPVLTLDNLSTGHRQAITHGDFIQADLADETRLQEIFSSHKIDAVIHLAGSIVVEESMRSPEKYYSNNMQNSLRLVNACVQHGVKHFVFSSTAAVYADPGDTGVCEETSPIAPVSPYGKSKWMVEQILMDYARAYPLKVVCLRYFNVAGADPAGEIGPATPQPSGLFPILARVATGQSPEFAIYGDDYPTSDGTGVRDYIHVSDLASAHLKALDYLQAGGESVIMNCGYGKGYSVKQVLGAVEKDIGKKLKIKVAPRRRGDLAKVIADNARIRSLLAWRPRFDNLDAIVSHSLRWEKERRY